ncbi:general secretion pathway protein I [Novosphingobium capsulatum]|uniref:Type II secretion system protein I n=1 Tax=Novosphingobium capsulatum TaxID=13688 RepID=A0ABU1MNL7_9SPHN|nr:type II secretion system minor pseudopilin GspI [Novosphingobium capsulatum]MDR6511804.1 general secretion pathway protein I [Novosphingobium capsulatum]
MTALHAQAVPPSEAGFSLLEVMVALAVFAIAALALLRLEAASLAGSATLDRRFLREVEAGNQATQWRADAGGGAPGIAGGIVINGGRRLAWQRVVRRDGAVLVAQISVRALDAPQEVAVARAVRAAP